MEDLDYDGHWIWRPLAMAEQNRSKIGMVTLRTRWLTSVYSVSRTMSKNVPQKTLRRGWKCFRKWMSGGGDLCTRDFVHFSGTTKLGCNGKVMRRLLARQSADISIRAPAPPPGNRQQMDSERTRPIRRQRICPSPKPSIWQATLPQTFDSGNFVPVAKWAIFCISTSSGSSDLNANHHFMHPTWISCKKIKQVHDRKCTSSFSLEMYAKCFGDVKKRWPHSCLAFRICCTPCCTTNP